MKRSWLWWSALSALGLVILAADEGRPIITLSGGHGLSLVDTIGVALLAAGWLALDVSTWRRRRRISLRRGTLAAIGVIGLAAAALVAWSILGDNGAWWVAGVVILGAIQLVAATLVT